MEDFDIFLTFVWAFFISAFSIPSIVRVSHIKNILDEPNQRTVHINVTPRLGGMSIFAGFVSALTLFGNITPSIQKLLAACILLFFVGLKDDVVNVSVFKKFFAQLLAANIVVFLGGLRITNLHGFLNVYELNEGISYGFTIFTIIGVTNSINLIDGLDGLAGTIVLIITASFGYFFMIYGIGEDVYYTFVAAALIGGLVGFLRFNLHKAIIFMGDGGSLLVGLLVSALAIRFIEMPTPTATPAIAVAVLIVPIFDTLRVFAIRIYRGMSPFSPDKNHIHHVLMRLGVSPLFTVFILATVNLLFVVLTSSFRSLGTSTLLIIIISVSVVIGLVIEFLLRRKLSKEQPKINV